MVLQEGIVREIILLCSVLLVIRALLRALVVFGIQFGIQELGCDQCLKLDWVIKLSYQVSVLFSSLRVRERERRVRNRESSVRELNMQKSGGWTDVATSCKLSHQQ